MIQYNWGRVKRQAKGSDKEILHIMDSIVWGNTRTNRHTVHKWKDYLGLSFLLEPELLLTKSYTASDREIVEYIELASYRPLAEYLLTGKTTLDFRTIPDSRNITNQLLTIENNEVRFKYE